MTDATLQRFAPPALGDMRAALDSQGRGSVTHCEAGTFVTLQRDGVVWVLRLTNPDGPEAQTVCARLATAVGAPSLDWRREQGGAVAWADWVEWQRPQSAGMEGQPWR